MGTQNEKKTNVPVDHLLGPGGCCMRKQKLFTNKIKIKSFIFKAL